VTGKDRDILRELARPLAEAAADGVHARRAAMWRSFNALRPARPMVLAFPEGGWRDLVSEGDLVCEDATARAWELRLRRRLFHAGHIHDDQPVTDTFDVAPVVHVGDCGLVETYVRTEALGSHVWDPPVKGPEDLKKLHPRRLAFDGDETARRLDRASETFGDVLRVRRRGHLGWPAPLSWSLIKLRGLEQVMVDIYDDPGLLRDLMAFLGAEDLRKLQWLEAKGLLSLNNGPGDYVGSGGLGATDELPADGFNGRVRLRDLWGFAESQEFVLIAPEHWLEFVLTYQLPILERFGLNHYGCCEPLDRWYDLLFEHVPRLRRLSISPWADRELAARRLGGRYIYSWKPNPAMICAPTVDWDAVERTTRETIEVASAHGCALEIVMKDTHTFCGDPTRIERWSRLVGRLVREAA